MKTQLVTTQLPNPAPVKRNDPVFKSIMDAYADSQNRPEKEGYRVRNLNFRAAQPVSRDVAKAILNEAIPHGYNEFQAELIGLLPEDAQVTIAREGSPCIYVKGKLDKNLQGKMKTDEFDYEAGADETRIWWD